MTIYQCLKFPFSALKKNDSSHYQRYQGRKLKTNYFFFSVGQAKSKAKKKSGRYCLCRVIAFRAPHYPPNKCKVGNSIF
jgi:hypothetical protein